ncbi:hypothetical protein KM043_012782 [Ampulex compressa]|nr:hypothetical protein KM043_012782 [Ampulex compressa]
MGSSENCLLLPNKQARPPSRRYVPARPGNSGPFVPRAAACGPEVVKLFPAGVAGVPKRRKNANFWWPVAYVHEFPNNSANPQPRALYKAITLEMFLASVLRGL